MKLGIIGAMDIEVHHLIKNIKNPRTKKIANRTFYIGSINNIDVIIVKSGIGLVNAAITAQILIDYFSPNYIINTGIAGSLNDNVKIFDVVISNSCVQYEFDATAFGYLKGQIPQRDSIEFKSSEYLTTLISHMNLDTNLHIGRIISADKFISDKNRRSELAVNFSALCVEMESGGIAHVCSDNNTEFVIVRTISDNASSLIDYNTIEEESAKISNKIILNILSNIKEPV